LRAVDRTIIFFIGIFALTLLGITLINPKSFKGVEAEHLPKFEFGNYTAYRIDEQGVGLYLQAALGRHYESYNELAGVVLKRHHDDVIESIRAEEAFVQSGSVDFNGSVHYTYGNLYHLYSQDMRYLQEDEMVFSKSPFRIQGPSWSFAGESFELDLASRKLNARTIRGIIETEETP